MQHRIKRATRSPNQKPGGKHRIKHVINGAQVHPEVDD
jgi:hypothetical protein